MVSNTAMDKQERRYPEISVVILCYKEGQRAADFINEVTRLLEAKELDYELILVANFYARERQHPDVLENSRILHELAACDKRIMVIEREKEGGFGWDMRTGLEAATGNYVAVTDGDGQIPADDIMRVYEIIAMGGYDCVKTFRVRRGDGSFRTVISSYYNLLLRLVFPGMFSSDVNGKPKIFTRSALARMDLRSPDWFIDAEMLIQGSYLGFRFVEISAVFNEMTHRRSYIRFGAIFESIKNIIVYRLTRTKKIKT